MSSLPSSSTVFLSRIASDYPGLSFRPGRKFKFRPKSTIYYVPDTDTDSFPLLLLHELAHALLKHYSFSTGAARLRLETAAWERTHTLCNQYSIPYNPAFGEAELSTYRDWLYQRTLCPFCSSTCTELNLSTLFCPFCERIIKK